MYMSGTIFVVHRGCFRGIRRVPTSSFLEPQIRNFWWLIWHYPDPLCIFMTHVIMPLIHEYYRRHSICPSPNNRHTCEYPFPIFLFSNTHHWLYTVYEWRSITVGHSQLIPRYSVDAKQFFTLQLLEDESLHTLQNRPPTHRFSLRRQPRAPQSTCALKWLFSSHWYKRHCQPEARALCYANRLQTI
jgi:hypothetical protein